MTYKNYLEVIQEEFPLREGYSFGYRAGTTNSGSIMDYITISYCGTEFGRSWIPGVGSIGVWRRMTEIILIPELDNAYHRQDLLGSPLAETRPKVEDTKTKKWWKLW